MDRAGGIRTHDLLNPIQAHYQAVLRPDAKEAQDAAPTLNIQAGKELRPPGMFDSSLALQDLLRAGLIGDQSANPPAPERPKNGFGFRPAAGESDDRFLGRAP
jgi:hypothetical protein